jgi:uncharacterized SAM-binding protein YcdF (DUF218 family)
LNNANSSLSEKCIAAAQKNSWLSRIEEMNNLIAETIDTKAGVPFDWKEGFSKLYKAARRKFLKAFFIFLSAYLLIFYTPLFWFLAAPLRISQLPEKADAILVFAGGVGESGAAGQGYEERVQYAAELYKKGYAEHIVFSSGFTYVFKEPYLMKTLAMSLGIPEKAIILEERASNTYENVKCTESILRKEQWNKVLLVSSPYHMRRASLVFNKIANQVKVNYAPVSNSLFYSHPDRDSYGRKIWKRISLEQIKGILHEYLGILYYWWKGYI